MLAIRTSLPLGELTRWQRVGLGVLALVIAVFGGIVELRSAFLKRPMTDLQVYLRASWAVRVGTDLYCITDDNDWHYHYPPLLAILMTPLADAPAGADRTGMMPFSAAVAIWYGFSVVCLFWGIHLVARALEETSACAGLHNPQGLQHWWALRILPVLVCFPAIGGTLARGQVNLLVLAVLCGMIAAALRGRRGQAGLWLAAAICIKLIPAYLVVYPLWRRDLRWLVGCAAGLMIGMGLIPLAVFGPSRTMGYYAEWTDVLLRPGLGQIEEPSRAKELLEVTATDSQSFLATIHNTRYPNRTTRPDICSRPVRCAHWLISGALTLATLSVVRGPRREDGPNELLILGVLIQLMILVSPVCHLHYFCLAVPLVMGLFVTGWERGGLVRKWGGLALLLTAFTIANLVPRLPVFYHWRDFGLPMYAALLLWLASMIALSRSRRSLHPQPGVSA
jgi:hypothetical protein